MSEDNQQQKVITRVDGYIEQYSGPIPPPGLLHDYEQVLPGIADRIVAMAEYEQKHRIYYETRGIWMAFVLALALILLSAYVVSLGYALASVAVVGTAITSIAGAFIYSDRSRRKELREKREAFLKPSTPPELPDGADANK